MDYHVKIPPGTPLSAFDCIVTWNQLKPTSAAARARLTQAIPRLFDRGTVTGTTFVLTGVTPEATSETLHHLLRLVLQHRGIHQPTALRELTWSDGTPLLEMTFLD